MNSETKQCKGCKKDFTIEPDDFSFYEKMEVPAPTLCSKCRRVRRLSWRNDWGLYSRDCSLCSKKFISIYAPHTPFKLLCPKCFHGDGWNPFDYGMDYDPNRSFIEQCIELQKKTPTLGVINDNDIASTNCLYTNDVAFSKNCAMVFIAWKLENVFNSVSLAAGKDLSDCLGVAEESQYSYDGVMINGVSNCKSIYWCTSCVSCSFCYDCRGCQDCFMSSGLRNKKYYFKNQQYSKDEYEKIIASYELHTRTGYKKAKDEFVEFLKDKPRQFAELRNCTACLGTDMIRSKNVKNARFASFSEDSNYVFDGVNFKSCYDCTVGGETELSYECITPDNSYHSISTLESWKNTHVAYCFDCHSSQNLLGCVGVKKGEYCILNKKYSKEEYLALYEKIVADMKARGEWGEFFPTKYSPFGINETQAQRELNLSKEDAVAAGYAWQDNMQETRGRETIGQQDVANSINDISDSFSSEILACTTCQRNYKILPEELTLYRRLLVPIPTECFFCRHAARERMRGDYDLIKRQCDCNSENHGHENQCVNEFQTFFTKREPRPIYCEVCYQKELL